ncbi:hypothetical protein ScPMuIL_007133 [Solemya velum]
MNTPSETGSTYLLTVAKAHSRVINSRQNLVLFSLAPIDVASKGKIICVHRYRMAAVVAENDIDNFIQNQKTKLQYEREILRDDSRKRWDTNPAQDNRFAEEQQEQENLPDDTGLVVGDTQVFDKQKQLRDERSREYNEYLQKNMSHSPRRRPKTPAETGLPLGKHEDERRILNEERKREYNEQISKAPAPKRDPQKKFEDAPRKTTRKPAIDYQKRHEEMLEEKHQDYVDHLEKKKLEEEKRHGGPTGLPPKPTSSRGFLSKIGKKADDQQKLKDERQKEYLKYLAEQKVRTKGQVTEEAADYTATIPGIRDHQSAELVKMKQRNEEYNVFLKEKQEKEQHRFADKKPVRHGQPQPSEVKNKQGIFASIPGLSYSDSPQGGPVNGEFPPGGPGRGFQSPTYEDILDQKRKEEAQYRRNDPDYGRQRDVADQLAEREYNARNANLRDYPQGILEDDDWLHPTNQRREADYADLMTRLAKHNENEREGRRPEIDQQEDDEKVDRSDKENMARTDAPYYATLPVGRSGIIGQEPRESAKRRKREEYRKELELQIKETEAAKRREKLQDMKVSATGFLDPEKNANRMGQLGQAPTEVSPRREYRAANVQPYHTKFDLQQREPEGRSILDAERDFEDEGFRPGRSRRREAPNSGILDKGFENFLEPRRNVGNAQLPPGLMYTPSTYVTAGTPGMTGGFGAPSGPYSSTDKAYEYYGMRNPLEPDPSGPGPVMVQQDQRVSFGQDAFQSPTPRVTFEDNVSARRTRDRSRERISPYQFNSDEDTGRKSRQDQQSYQAELDRQIYEKRRKKVKEKEEKDNYERKLEEEMKNYNPFGRGGGGAPIRDSGGNAIADLRLMRKGNEGGDTFRQYDESPARMSPLSRLGSPRDDLIKAPPPQTNFTGETTFARGGHGIFGMPKTETEKTQMEKYKDELRKQIEEKKMKEKLEKDKEMLEEQRENKRLEDQRLKIQSEYEAEVKKARAKEDEARRQNEAIKEQAEQRRKDLEKKKREQDEKRQDQLREDEERERQKRVKEQELQQRLASPPVPAVRTRETENKDNLAEDRRASPAIQTKRNPDPEPRPGPSTETERISASPDRRYDPPQRTNSSEVLGELARMRKQLEIERVRVQNALENSKNEPEVFDPRMVQRPPPRDIVVMERDRDRLSSLPPRAGNNDSANQKHLQTFNELKYRGNSDSRRQFRSLFPEAPISGSTLEAQQDALLRQQEDSLKNYSDKHVDGVNHFPDDFEDMPFRNTSARHRRKERYPLSPRPESQPYNPLGSQTSLDVDRIQRKNDERLRNLKAVHTTDDVSLADPDDILDRFMAKQSYRTRPPSGQTLQDDSWLRPGSKQI